MSLIHALSGAPQFRSYLRHHRERARKGIAILAAVPSGAPATPSGVAARDMRFVELAEQISARQALVERTRASASTDAPKTQQQRTAETSDYVLPTRAHGKVLHKDLYVEGVT